jgi:hypothetical protein
VNKGVKPSGYTTEMKEAVSSEKFTSNHKTAMCHNSEDRQLDTSRRDELKHQLLVGLFSFFFHLKNTMLSTLVNPLTPNDL